MQDTVRKIVDRFELQPHPEGGYFREVYRSTLTLEHPGLQGARRCGSTLIYFLLTERDFSAFHRVRASDEVWHLYGGGPLELHTIDTASGRYARQDLLTDLELGQPVAVVPAGSWQAARVTPNAAFAFCGCTVAPGFDFADFEMPPAQELVAQFPAHERIIRELTRR